ncbi:hypothetical protein DITRI_Ditri15bG0117700 [Diplodiscus trichospermus]
MAVNNLSPSSSTSSSSSSSWSVTISETFKGKGAALVLFLLAIIFTTSILYRCIRNRGNVPVPAPALATEEGGAGVLNPLNLELGELGGGN